MRRDSQMTRWVAWSLLAIAAVLRAADAPGPAANASLPAPYVTKSSSLAIPFSVSNGTGELEPVEVQVHISYDRGANWNLYARHRPSDGEFVFRSRRDAEYWLATRTIDRRNQSHPAGPLAPQMRVIVDTAAPRLELSAEPGLPGEVLIVWKAIDETLDPSSVKLEGQIATSGVSVTWKPIDAGDASVSGGGTAVEGRTSWKPQGAGRVVNVRATVHDKAGNTATASRQVFLSKLKTEPLAATPDKPKENPYEILNREAQAAPQNMLPPVPVTPTAPRNNALSLDAASPPPSNVGGQSWPAEPRNDSLRPSNPDAPRETPTGPSNLIAQDNGQGPGRLASSGAANAPPPSTPPAGRIQEDWLAVERPRLTASKRFSLEYDVEAVAPDNLADVELWGTNDGGRNWMKWGSDADRASPFDVEVGGETIYGFRIVIVAKNGVASKPPQPGDPADVWVQVDATKPTCRLTQAAYGQGERAGQLDLRWEAADPNLTDRCVTLQFADRPDGPFTTIAANLPNNGQYWWQFDPRTPRKLYLRLEVRDAAGNIGVHQPPEPISVEGLAPRGRIRGLTTPEAVQGAFRAPLFR